MGDHVLYPADSPTTTMLGIAKQFNAISSLPEGMRLLSGLIAVPCWSRKISMSRDQIYSCLTS